MIACIIRRAVPYSGSGGGGGVGRTATRGTTRAERALHAGDKKGGGNMTRGQIEHGCGRA